MASVGPTAEVARCVDRWNRTIVLEEATRVLHILPDRAPLVGSEAAVRLTLTAPQFVKRDATRADRKVYDRREALPSPY